VEWWRCRPQQGEGDMAGLDKLIKKATDYAKKNPDKVKSVVEKVKAQATKRKGH
jgi:hypothetical protein